MTTPGKPKQPPSEDPEITKLKGKIKQKVNDLGKVSDVLTGKDIPDGKVGDKIRAKRELEKNEVAGKKSRDKKHKKFDEWLERQQRINNTRDGNVPSVRIKRAVIKDEKGMLY